MGAPSQVWAYSVLDPELLLSEVLCPMWSNARLRAQGHTVVCVLPGHESEVDEFHCDRALVLQSGGWTLTTL